MNHDPLVNQPSEAEYYGLTARALAHPKGELTDNDLIERVKAAMIFYNPNDDMAQLAIAAVRAYDREQRAKIDEALARHNEARHGGMNMYVETRRDPDDYRDPFSLVTRMARGPGITEG